MQKLPIGVVLLIFGMPLSGWTAIDPSQETLRISQYLRPISDEQWRQIAGSQIKEKYEVISGDHLWGISNRLFGDGFYWPKVWSLNNRTILNPHVIEPGQMVAFLPGSGTQLPSVAIQTDDGQTMADARQPVRNARSEEWRYLPRQRWESVVVQLPPDIDPLGFDKSNKITKNTASTFEIEAIAKTDPIEPLGEVVGSRSAADGLTLRDAIYIEAENDSGLQIGELYSVTSEPLEISPPGANNNGYSYYIKGHIKIRGVRDGLYIAEVLAARAPILREDKIIPAVKKIRMPKIIPGPEPKEGILGVDRRFSTGTTAQHKLVFVDLGSDDGVQPGMVFRAYQHEDPGTGSEITESHFIVDADFLVVQTGKNICAAIAISSVRSIREGAEVILLTDVSEFHRIKDTRVKSLNRGDEDRELDELDALDPGGGLGPGEERELKQLEQWDGTLDTPAEESKDEPKNDSDQKNSEEYEYEYEDEDEAGEKDSPTQNEESNATPEEESQPTEPVSEESNTSSQPENESKSEESSPQESSETSGETSGETNGEASESNDNSFAPSDAADEDEEDDYEDGEYDDESEDEIPE